uniref:Tobamovirus multiplication protein 2A n=1 Tax=Ananas comosus var. bracteatus TaxID=296719 RepID=A0A6V7NQE9_ANACO|nr:unnamed protein product [Ananas comosus var. bracteatus]
MACEGFWRCLLKLLNFVLMVAGLGMVGNGVYLLVEWSRVDFGGGDELEMLEFGRPMFLTVSASASFVDRLPRAWFIYLFIGIGVILFIISCFGCLGATTRNRCCLSFYSFLIILMILVELAAAAVIFFDHSWRDAIPADKTGDFEMIYTFLKDNWKIAKWVALGAVVLEALMFLLALIVRIANEHADYDSDDKYIAPRLETQKPLINRINIPSSGVPTLDNRPVRNDTWSQRIRKKYGHDTLEFTYNPTDPSRFQQATIAPANDRGQCAIL